MSLGSPLTLILAVGIIGSAAIVLRLNKEPLPEPRDILLSPRTTLLPKLTEAQIKSLGYPPDALPGARDISTPYGSMRVYEWGPLDGRRVVMVHGDTTPSPLFGPIAKMLVARGCRVLTFDLWGRGYTDAPVGAPHHSRLYMSQIFYAISTSEISWVGVDRRFSIIGFSMGGGITVDFVAHHPLFIESMVLLGPGGLVRKLPDEYGSLYLRYPAFATRTKIRSEIAKLLAVKNTSDPLQDVQAYQKQDSSSPEGFTPVRGLQFQFDYHVGLTDSLLSNIRFAPYQRQDAVWNKAFDIIAGRSTGDERASPLFGGKILAVGGADDTIVPAAHVKEDLEKLLGPEGKHWEFKMVPGGHNFPWDEAEKVGNAIIEFWGL